ncbi:hypothetical protein COV19_03080 [Candidatus Woesearchaeota archaeon CG10_big_fil_rev_8_21_14_0_10_44_13]|nr:MAG: hypothetical protein COV19_03080 [Candidatus Woesearchaeota archaeon CG10_big_fil_rev_8_21_14_0_10_44_13]
MAIERTYIIPLRREWLKVQRYKRAKKAVRGVKEFLAKHMKQEDPKMIKIGTVLNEMIWGRGIRNPPHKVKVSVVKEADGLVKAELFGHKYIEKKKVEKKEEGGIAGKLKEAIGGGKEKKEKEVEAEITEDKEGRKEDKKEKAPEKKEEKHVHKEVKREEKKPAHKEEKKPAKK